MDQLTMTPTLISDRDRLLDVIGFMAEVTGAVSDPRETMRVACERAQTLTDAAGAVIELADGDDMVYDVTTGSLTAHVGTRLAVGSSVSGLAVRRAQALRCDDSETDPRVDREACRRVGLRSMLCVPLNHDGATVGVLKVVSPRTGAFDDTDVAILTVISGVVASAMTQAELIRRLHEEATTDALTGLANRRQWQASVTAALARARRTRRPVTVMLLDLNDFKAINDSDGHDAGDQVLREAARRWSACVRAGDLLARIGGDEFALLLEDLDQTRAAALIRRLQRGVAPVCAVSIGVATGCDDDADALVRRADVAMYRDKARHRAEKDPTPASR